VGGIKSISAFYFGEIFENQGFPAPEGQKFQRPLGA
jgi:hypothetical protein